MSYTATSAAAFGTSQAGLATVGYTVLNWDGTVYIARTTTGVADLGHGGYGVTGILVADGAVHPVRWDTGGATPVYALDVIAPDVQSALTAQGYTTGRAGYLDRLDVAVSSRAVSGTPITVVSPTSVDGTEITVVCGDDYGGSPAQLQRFVWTLAAGEYPDLTGGSVTLYLAGYSGAQGTGTVVTGSATAAQTVAVDFAAAQTAALTAPADVAFTLVVTTSTGNKQQTLVPRGVAHLVARASS